LVTLQRAERHSRINFHRAATPQVPRCARTPRSASAIWPRPTIRARFKWPTTAVPPAGHGAQTPLGPGACTALRSRRALRLQTPPRCHIRQQTNRSLALRTGMPCPVRRDDKAV